MNIALQLSDSCLTKLFIVIIQILLNKSFLFLTVSKLWRHRSHIITPTVPSFINKNQ